MNEYLDYINTVQALRRRTEGLTLAFGGALGIAAHPMPHQLATVQRLLSETSIRHLIADEVGLGKTVQALMVLNALRWQFPEHRTLIVAPERLHPQWNEECWARAHVMTTLDQHEDQTASVNLVRPADLVIKDEAGGRLVELDGRRHDLLIIDEPQTMPLEVVDHLARNSGNFRQLLVLSATPRLADLRWREPIMRMLEPELAEMARRAGKPILQALQEREEQAIQLVMSGEDLPLYRVAAANRRIIRNGRRDWAEYLPQRKNIEITVPPLRAERLRHELAATLPIMDRSGGTDAAGWAQVKALQGGRRLAGPILQDLRQRDDAIATLANTTAEISRDELGDSRLEALLTLLSEQWTRDAAERFVVVCGNTPTMRFLEASIPKYFPELEGKVLPLERPPGLSEDSHVSYYETYGLFDKISSGEFQILLIGDWIQAGINLHGFSRNIVFYSVPWKVDAIDQFIGRVDRLHPDTIMNPNRDARDIRIWRILINGSQEQNVAQVLANTGVFDRPLPPMTDEDLAQLGLDQAQAARGFGSPSQTSEKTLKQMAILPSKLSDLSPWTLKFAQQIWENFSRRTPIEPVLIGKGSYKGGPIEISERALRGWLKVINKAQDFQIETRRDRVNHREHFDTLWYGHAAGRNCRVVFPLSDMESDRFMSDHKPFIHNRARIALPPVRTVATDDGEEAERPLHFLDHGDVLHDELIEGYLRRGLQKFGEATIRENLVRVPQGHPAAKLPGIIMLTSLMWDPVPDDCLPLGWSEAARTILSGATSDAQRKLMEHEHAKALDAYRAFQRWMRLHIAATLQTAGAQYDPVKRSWIKIKETQVLACLKPMKQFSSADATGKHKELWMRGRVAHGRQLVPEASKKMMRDSLISELSERAYKEGLARYETLSRLRSEFKQVLEAERSSLHNVRRDQVKAIRTVDVSPEQEPMRAGQLAAAERNRDLVELLTGEIATFIRNSSSTLSSQHGIVHATTILHIVPDE